MPGTKFTKETLVSQITARYDELIAKTEEQLDEANYTTHEMRLDLWREQCRRLVRDMADRVDDISDIELSGFKLPYAPSSSDRRYELERLEKENEGLRKRRHKILTYVSSLAPAEDGTVELYAHDLRRIGYEA